MRFDIITLFPKMLEGFLNESILGRAQVANKIAVGVHDLRQYSDDVKHHTVDDRPFGGGPGMVLKPTVLAAAIDALKKPKSKVVYLCPDGDLLSTKLVHQLAEESHLILLSGHYEGIDQRIRDHWVDYEVSIGDYVLTNGTLPAAVLVDAVSRHIPGVLGESDSVKYDSFENQLLSFPQYTRPANFCGHGVPDILLSGHHEAIADWRLNQQRLKTAKRRPDLL